MSAWSTSHAGVVIDVRHEGESLVVAAADPGAGDVALERLLAALRHASSHAELTARGVDGPFRVEDLLALAATVPAAELGPAERWLRRRLARDTALTVAWSAGTVERIVSGK